MPGTVARTRAGDYVGMMSETPEFLDGGRPPVPELVVPRGVTAFFLPGQPVRGRLVRLGKLADALLTRHHNPPVVTRLAGQALALAAGLAAALKFSGSFSLQAKGDGPVPQLLADCTDTGELRFYARTDADRLAEVLAATSRPAADELLGAGYLAFTVDQGADLNRHQGIVAIEGTNLAEMALHYFRTSEQLRYFLHLACEPGPEGWQAGALILEKIAGAGGLDPALDEAAQEESWITATTLAGTLTDAELLDESLPPEHLLYRLFHSEGVAIDRARALSYGCRCSRARLAGILEGFSPDDLDHMAVDGDIVMTCEFCNFDFRFPRTLVQGKT
jgi:molecular chaperone Hsp33